VYSYCFGQSLWQLNVAFQTFCVTLTHSFCLFGTTSSCCISAHSFYSIQLALQLLIFWESVYISILSILNTLHQLHQVKFLWSANLLGNKLILISNDTFFWSFCSEQQCRRLMFVSALFSDVGFLLLFQLQEVLLGYIANPQLELALVMLIVPFIVNVSFTF